MNEKMFGNISDPLTDISDPNRYLPILKKTLISVKFG